MVLCEYSHETPMAPATFSVEGFAKRLAQGDLRDLSAPNIFDPASCRGWRPGGNGTEEPSSILCYARHACRSFTRLTTPVLFAVGVPSNWANVWLARQHTATWWLVWLFVRHEPLIRRPVSRRPTAIAFIGVELLGNYLHLRLTARSVVCAGASRCLCGNKLGLRRGRISSGKGQAPPVMAMHTLVHPMLVGTAAADGRAQHARLHRFCAAFPA